MKPDCGRSSPAISRSNVDFPQPEGPNIARNCACGTSRSSPSSATTPFSNARLTRETRTANPSAARSPAGVWSNVSPRATLQELEQLLVGHERSPPQYIPGRIQHEQSGDVFHAVFLRRRLHVIAVHVHHHRNII